jgi:hypothetical protein
MKVTAIAYDGPQVISSYHNEPDIPRALEQLGADLADSAADELRIEIRIARDELALTAEQRLAAYRDAESNDGELLAVHLHVATADEMDEPARYGRDAVPQNSGTVAYPVAALVTSARDDGGVHEIVSLYDAEGGVLSAWERQ